MPSLGAQTLPCSKRRHYRAWAARDGGSAFASGKWSRVKGLEVERNLLQAGYGDELSQQLIRRGWEWTDLVLAP